LKEYFLNAASIDKKQTTLLPFLVGIGADNFAICYKMQVQFFYTNAYLGVAGAIKRIKKQYERYLSLICTQ
jgi:hypothetical protein